jgi:coenzyme F420-reducing hydrogenase alpha subunit
MVSARVTEILGRVGGAGRRAREAAGTLSSPDLEYALRGQLCTEPDVLSAGAAESDRAAYRVCACRAVEAAVGEPVPAPVEELRRLLCCAEWIESHAAQIYLVQALDFLGCRDVSALARRERAAFANGLVLMRLGSEITKAGGGGSDLPNLGVGGFTAVPSAARLTRLLRRIDDAIETALETAVWVAGFDYPESLFDVPMLALDDPVAGGCRYPLDRGGGVVTTSGLGFPLDDFESSVRRTRATASRPSTALIRGARAQLTGPLARFALAAGTLHPLALLAARSHGLTPRERNPHRSILIRAVELIHALVEARALIEKYVPPDPPRVTVVPRPATGFSATEAPTGLLYQRYAVRGDGMIRAARIIGPAELNHAAIELDTRLALRHASRRDQAMPEQAGRRVRDRIEHNYGTPLRTEGSRTS